MQSEPVPKSEHMCFLRSRSKLLREEGFSNIKDWCYNNSKYGKMEDAFSFKLADYYRKCLNREGDPHSIRKWEDVKATKPCKQFEAYVNHNFSGAFSAEELWSEQQHLGVHGLEFMVCFHARNKRKQYIIPLDTHWTHCNVATYGLGEDDQHDRQAAVTFLQRMQQAVQIYQSSASSYKNTGPVGFHSIGGHMGVFFTHLRLQSECPPSVVTIDQAMKVLKAELKILGKQVESDLSNAEVPKEGSVDTAGSTRAAMLEFQERSSKRSKAPEEPEKYSIPQTPSCRLTTQQGKGKVQGKGRGKATIKGKSFKGTGGK
jgi:hypothetical protein